MDALIVGPLSVNETPALSEQSLALATFALSFRGLGDPSNSVLDEVNKLPAIDVAIINRYRMQPPKLVVYPQSGDSAAAAQTAEAVAEAFEKMTGVSIAVAPFSGKTADLKHDSVVIIDPTRKPLRGVPSFEFADLTRRKEVSERPSGGDCNSGLAALGSLTKDFVALMKKTWIGLGIA